ncbi:MAG: hypothetical protein ACI3VR_09340, partial [Intestinibacter sp.]|uniref:hypothetical protein n=1 Tax=Intestinibacter sp. TaxID=1965304 RepID=UPI003F1431C7
MGEGKGRMFFKNSNLELDYIVKELLNNEEFLSRVAEKISSEYLRDKDNCSIDQELAIDNIENVGQEDKCWSQEVHIEHNLDKYVEQIEILNREKKKFNKKIDELICENKRLLEERNNLKTNLDDISRKSKEIIDIKDQEISDLKNKHYKAEVNMKHSLETKDKELYNKEIELRQKDKVILQQQSEIKDLQSEFSSIKESYNLFLSLNDEIKEDMISILRGDKIENFVYAGVQYKNIESIWEYAKN